MKPFTDETPRALILVLIVVLGSLVLLASLRAAHAGPYEFRYFTNDKPTATPTPLAVPDLLTPLPFDAALAHPHVTTATIEGNWTRRWHVDTIASRRPPGWDEAQQGRFIEGTPYILGNTFWITLDDGGSPQFFRAFDARDTVLISMVESRIGGARVRVTYDPHCRYAIQIDDLGYPPKPTPTPEPKPTPKPWRTPRRAL